MRWSLRKARVLAAGVVLSAAGNLAGADAPVPPRAAGAATPPAFWTWAQTPPMGWNSFDSYGDSVTEAEFLANAQYMKEHLLAHGWQYAVVDYRWYDPLTAGSHTLVMDANGRLLPAPNRFPSAANGAGFKPLADKTHALGLKFGIHIMRGIPRQAVQANSPIDGSNFTAAAAADTASVCKWNGDMFGVNAATPAGQAWYDSLFRQYAAWGVDFVKVDDLTAPYSAGEVEAIRKAIDACGRPIVFSTSPGETPIAQAEHVVGNANLWRISGDFWDSWQSLQQSFMLLARWQGQSGPGHWPDADMIAIGHLSPRCPVGGKDRWTNFTKPEQVTLMTLWSVARSPLILGMNLPDNDAWTLSLLTNDEVLAVNQHSRGNRQLSPHPGGPVIWVADMPGATDKYVALFNRRDGPGAYDFNEPAAKYHSPLVTPQTPGQAVDMDVDITSAKQLWLVVDDGGDTCWNDHADWAEPRLVGPAGELKLTELKWTSASSFIGEVKLGRAFSGNPLVIDGKPVADGIGANGRSVIAYELPAGYTHFKARGGLDREGVKGSVKEGLGATVRFLVFTENPQETRADAGARVTVSLRDLGFTGSCAVRDLWGRQDLGTVTTAFDPRLPWHGAGLYRISPAGR